MKTGFSGRFINTEQCHTKFFKKSYLCLLNLNSLRNKITDLKIFLQHIPLCYFVLSKTKLDNSFPTVHFRIPWHEIRARSDQNKYRVLRGGGGVN